MELLMTIPTTEQYDATLDAIQTESPCQDGSCYHCQINKSIRETELASVLVNNILKSTLEDSASGKDSLQAIGDAILKGISDGIQIGLRIAEVRELEKLNQ
jgi:hypothetical protein